MKKFIAAVALAASAAALASCSSGPEGSEDEALTACLSAVTEKYPEAQRPPDFDWKLVRQEDDTWKVSGMVRGTHPLGKGEKSNTSDPKRSSKDMAHMRFDCTVDGDKVEVTTWRLATGGDITEQKENPGRTSSPSETAPASGSK